MSDFKKSETTIQSGQHVLIRLPSEGLKIVHLQDTGIIGLGNLDLLKFPIFWATHWARHLKLLKITR